jgi:hypothetical protein
MKVFLQRIKAKSREQNPTFTLREISELVKAYELEVSKNMQLSKKVKRGY